MNKLFSSHLAHLPRRRYRSALMAALLAIALVFSVLSLAPSSHAASASIVSSKSTSADTYSLVSEAPLRTTKAMAATSYSKWWVTTFANAHGYDGLSNILYAGYNYVFCKAAGPVIRDGAGNWNHWWLWTDMDTGGQDYVSAYYLKNWGNDVAKDDRGNVIPNCSSPTPPPTPPPSGNKWWVTTFANASGAYGLSDILYAGYNYVFCKVAGPVIRDSAGNWNHWWLWTDMDTGGQDYVSAYYLAKWGNDVAKDDRGNVIPNCSSSTPPPTPTPTPPSTPTPTPPPGSTLWGVDTAAPITSGFLSSVKANYGTPDFVGRYLDQETGFTTGLTTSEVSYIHGQSIKILLLESDHGGDTGSEGTTKANEAIQEAKALGVPTGNALFADIEVGSTVDSTFIQDWYNTITAAGYRAGIYANPLPGSSGFNNAFCASSSTVIANTVLYSTEPSPGATTRANKPTFAPTGPTCGGKTQAWQYGLASTASVNADFDEVKSLTLW